MKRFLFVLAGMLAVVAVPPAGRAARVEADPNKEYVISPEAGPFAICVHSYIGPDARELAHQLALHLRKNGWPAYVFDYTAEEQRKAREWIDERYRDVPPEARPKKTMHVEPQWAVFIGGYRDFDSASRDLPKVKQVPEPPQAKNDVSFLSQETKQLYHLNTYAQCMATRNPTVPMQKRDASAADPLWKELNDGRKYNLLKCGKPWTLAVKNFQGAVAVQPRSATSKFLESLGLGGKSGEMLDAGARQAEEIARVLRDKPFNYDAYVLHMRTGSIVTVGAFDQLDDPQMKDAAKKLKNLQFGLSADAIRLFAEPVPMKVPQL